jgi:hypothetical protein
MRSRSINTRWRPAVAIVLLTVAALLGACGTSRPNRAELLIAQTFAGGTRIHSGRLGMDVDVSRGGYGAAGHFSLRVQMAFQDNGSVAPSLRAVVSIDDYGEQVRTALTFVGGQVFIASGGHEYMASAAVSRAFRVGLAAGRRQGSGALALLGPLVNDASSWIADPRLAGKTSIGAVQVQRIEAGVDLRRLLRATGALSPAETALLPAELVTAHITGVRVQILVGVHDHLLRRLSGTARLVGLGEPSPPPGGMAPRVTASIEISEPGVAQQILAPAHAGSAAALAAALRRSGGLSFMAASAAGLPTAQSGSSKPSPSPTTSASPSLPSTSSSSSSSSSSASTTSSSSSPSSAPG